MRSLAVVVAVVATIFPAGCASSTSDKESTTTTTTLVSAATTAPQTAPGTVTKAPAGQAPAARPVAPANPAPPAPGPGPGFNTDFGGTCEGQEHCPAAPPPPE